MKFRHPGSSRSRRVLFATAAVALSVLLASCGDDGDNDATVDTTAPATTAAAGGPETTAGSGSGGAETTGEPAEATGDDSLLIAAIGNEPETLDVGRIRAGTDYYPAVNMFEQLLARDADGNQIPGLATDWEVSDDGLEYRFTLREDVTFHNGEPFDAEDVKFSYERFVDPDTGNVFAFQLASLDSVEVVSPTEVIIRMKEPNGAFIPANGIAYIVPKDYIEGGDPEIMNEQPVGTGPLKFVERQIGQGFTLERFDDYWGDKAGYQRIEVRIIPDDNGRVSALRSGQVDLIAQVPPQNVEQLKSDSSLKVEQAVTGDNIFVLYNYQIPDAPWLDKRVREAMEHAVDNEALRDVVLGELGVELTGVSALNDGYEDVAYSQREYDPDRAKELLAEAGYGDGFDLIFTAPVNGRLPNSEQVAQALAGFWTEIGINVDLQLMEYSQWVNSERRDSGVNGVMFGLGGDQASFDPQQRMMNHLICTAPYGNMCDENVDAMVREVQTTVDHDARVDAYQELFQYIHDEAQVFWLYTAEGAFAMASDVDWQPFHGTPYTRFYTARPA
jgi:peptide/nickel transport system substrate-binding protein